VTVSKVFTGVAQAFPELPVVGILTLHFVPEPGTLLLLGSGVQRSASAATARHWPSRAATLLRGSSSTRVRLWRTRRRRRSFRPPRSRVRSSAVPAPRTLDLRSGRK
jgi:hypothetical protein